MPLLKKKLKPKVAEAPKGNALADLAAEFSHRLSELERRVSALEFTLGKGSKLEKPGGKKRGK